MSFAILIFSLIYPAAGKSVMAIRPLLIDIIYKYKKNGETKVSPFSLIQLRVV